MHTQVTLIVVPRERFSHTRESLESIYQNTNHPFNLIYIDAGSPPHIRDYLTAKATEHQFQLIRTNYYLSPNHARNIGIKQATTEYIIFIDNDVIVSPQWLQSLIECAETTQATVISPLICQGTPLHTEIHCAGGETGVIESNTRRKIVEKIYKQGQKLVQASPNIQRQQTGLAEYHCVMVRREIFDKIGYLDEKLLSSKEHVDLCMLVTQAGGLIYLEPRSLVTYVPAENLEISDLPYYMLRWSDAWEKASLQHLRDKWNLTEDEYFKNRYNRLGWRRNMTIINPITSKMPFGKIGAKVAGKLLRTVDKRLNHYLTSRYAKRLHTHFDQSATS